MSIHPTAIIDPTAKIGKKVSIGPYAVIGPDSKIGDGCVIHSHAVIEYTDLGPECQVFPHACLGLPPQHFKYKGEKTSLKVGARCVFRESVTVHRGTMLDKGITVIGDDGYFMAFSHVAHDCRLGKNVILANAAQLAGHVEVGDYTFISATAGIHQFVRIGSVCMVSGGAMVPMDVASYCIAQGDRAVLRGVNIVGLRRMGADRATIQKIRSAYKTVFLSGFSLEEALRQPELTVDNKFISAFRAFLQVPGRGFVRPALNLAEDAPSEEVSA